MVIFRQFCSDTCTKESGNPFQFPDACSRHIELPGRKYSISNRFQHISAMVKRGIRILQNATDAEAFDRLHSGYKGFIVCLACMHHLQCKEWLIFRTIGKLLCFSLSPFWWRERKPKVLIMMEVWQWVWLCY